MQEKTKAAYNKIVVHYSEIGIKGSNRNVFENKLMDNVRAVLRHDVEKVYKRYGRIICDLKPAEFSTKSVTGGKLHLPCYIREMENSGAQKEPTRAKRASHPSIMGGGRFLFEKESVLEKIKDLLGLFPGIAHYSFAVVSKPDLNEIKQTSLQLLKNKDNSFTTFKVVAQRSNKAFKHNSQEINNIVGGHICSNLGKKVSMKTPDIFLCIEICEKEVFIYDNKHKGIGGLPVTSSGKIICSLSGGIDSPVASFLMMKRGCKVIFVHAYNQTLAKQAVLSKLDSIAQQLTKFQLNSKLFIVPFEKIQKQIIMNVPSNLRMIVYRRFMMKIINEIARAEKAKAVVTGDSVGQVASQTLENLQCIYSAAEIPVLCPLIGMNKEEITEIAKRIKTYEFSILPYPDCCSYMVAEHPSTKAVLKEILEAENNIENSEELIKESISKAEIKVFK